jgi:hypothetical protein
MLATISFIALVGCIIMTIVAGSREHREQARLESRQVALLETALATDINDTKECPYCGERVKTATIKCKHCGSDLTLSASGNSTPA